MEGTRDKMQAEYIMLPNSTQMTRMVMHGLAKISTCGTKCVPSSGIQ